MILTGTMTMTRTLEITETWAVDTDSDMNTVRERNTERNTDRNMDHGNGHGLGQL
jgi:hypothetical protein